MKSKIGLRILNLMVATLLVLGNVMMGSTPVLAQTGTATASATPSDAAPTVGDQITVVVNIDVSSVAAPDNALGSYTGTLDWDPAILDYQSYSSAPPSGFTGVVNTTGVDSGEITFNGANTSGATGNTIVISITFDVVGEGTSALDLDFSAMAAAGTFNSLLSVLTVNDGSVTATEETPVTLGLDGAVSNATGAANATSVSFSHTTGTGTDRLMLVGVSWNCGSTGRTISSVTFSYGAGPTVLNLSQKFVQETSSTTQRYAAIWYSQTEPPQNTTGTITVTFSGTVSNGIVAGAANFAGVDQTTPLGAAVGANSSSTGTTLSVTLDSLTGDELIFDTAFIGASTPPDPTVGADQTSLWSATVSNTRGVASIEQATSDSVTMSWTTGTTAVAWAIAAVPINPAGPDVTDPTVTIEQAAAQSDPTYDSPINFTVEFNESVNDFVTGDVTIGGTAGATTAVVTGSGKTYNVAVSGMTSSGTVSASIAAGVAHDAAGNPNEASTSTDNVVSFEYIPSGNVELDGDFSSNTADDVSSINITHTTGTGANRLMLVGVSWNSNTAASSITSVTFTPDGGSATALTEVRTEKASSNYRYAAIYQLLNPGSGVAGTVTVTFSASIPNGIVAGAANFKGVDQTTPLGTHFGANGSSTTASVTLTGLEGDELVFDTLFQGASADTQQLTAGSDQTRLWYPAYIANIRASASIEQATGDSVTMSWTATSSSVWAIAAVPINPAPLTPTCYALTLSHSGSGTTPTATPANSTGCSAGQYVASEAITLSGAVPDTGWAISGWSGTSNNTSTAATNSLTMPASAHAASVIYAQQEYTLTVNLVGSGSVAKDPNQATYHYNDVVELEATAASGWEFSAWSGALTGTTNPDSITMNGNKTVTATFTETAPPDSAVSSVTPSDTTPVVNDQITVVVNIDVSDVNAPNDALGSYTGTLAWDPAILEYQSYSSAPPTGFTGAVNTANVGTGLIAFNGAKATGATGNTIVISITFKVIGAGTSALDLAYSAMAAATTFTNLLPVLTINDSQVVVPAPIVYTLTLNHTGNGSVSANPSPPYYENDTVELTATADAGWSFTNWSGSLSGSDNPKNITMNSNKTVTANFTQNEYTLTVNTNGSGSVNVNPVKTTYHYGDVVTLTAVPDTDWVLSAWSGNLSGTTNPASLTITSNMSVTAHFIEDTPGTIAHIADIGSASNKTTGTSLVITTTSAVTAGDDIIVAFATYGDPDYTISITDSAGNTYEEVAQSICYEHGRTYIFAAYDVKALPSGSAITITHTSVAARAAVASVFRGLAKIDPLDQSLGNPAVGAQQTASGTTATVGPTGTTVQASELLIGAIGTEGPLGDTAGTWGNSFIAGLRAGTTGGDANSNWTISLGYRIVSSTGTYTAQKSGMTDRYWAAAIATFKADSGIPVLPEFTLLLSRPTDTSINTNAILERGGQIYYEYGTTPSSYTGQTGTLAATAGNPVEITMTGLLPDTQYYYRMVYSDDGDEWVESEEYTFHTQRAQDEAFTFTIASDSHLSDTFSGNDPNRYEQATLNIAADNPDFHIDLGDAFIMSAPDNQAEANAVYLAQRPYFDNFGRSTPIFLTIGNHENEEGWNLDDTPFSKALGSIIARKMYFPNPIPDGFYTGNTDLLPAVGGDQYREDYYAWEWGDVLFVVLDPFQYTMVKPYGTITGSGEDNDETVSGDQWNWTLGQQQYDWFKQTLEDSDAKFKFVFAHHIVGGQLNVSGAAGLPGYVRGGGLASDYFEWGGLNANDTWGFDTKRPGWGGDSIHTLMLDNGVNAFFHGHDHQFVHEEVDGIVYQLVPSYSMTGYGFDLYDSSPYVVSGGNLPNSGHVRVTVDGDEATVEYVRSAISGDTGVVNGTVSYSYTIEATTPTHDLTISIDPSGSGTTNPSAGTHTYTEGTLVTITPTPASGYAFDHWSGACTGSGACQVTMDANKSVVAHFSSLHLTISGDAGAAGVTLSYTDGTPKTATSAANGSYSFTVPYGWSGTVTPSLIGYTFNPANRSYTDVTSNLTGQDFTAALQSFTLSVTRSGTADVTITSSPPGIDCGNSTTSCSASFDYGTAVTLTAAPASDYFRLENWAGDCSGSGTCSLNITSAQAVTANIETALFADVPFNYTVTYGGVDYLLYPYIKTLYDAGYTSGCSSDPLMFCPANNLTRAEAAVFMLRAVAGVDYSPTVPTPPRFTDDDFSGGNIWAQAWVESMYTEGLSSGVSDTWYNAWAQLARDEASVFALRIKHGSTYSVGPANGTIFADLTDTSYWGTPWAEQAYLEGLLPACGWDEGKPMICATDNVSRALAAYMIVLAKDIELPE